MDGFGTAEFINKAASGEMMQCPVCGGMNKAGGRFCVHCGSPMKKKAPKKEPEPIVEEVREAVTDISVEDSQAETPMFGFATEEPQVEEEPQPMFSFTAEEPQVEEQPQPMFEFASEEPQVDEQLRPMFGLAEGNPSMEDGLEPAATGTDEATTVLFETEKVEITETPMFAAEEPTAPETPMFAAEKPTAPETPMFAAEEAPAFGDFSEAPAGRFAKETSAFGTVREERAAFAAAVSGARDMAAKDTDAPAFSAAVEAETLLEEGEQYAFAEGLPSWDLVPPQILVRRKR